jgi:hypothetical protein
LLALKYDVDGVGVAGGGCCDCDGPFIATRAVHAKQKLHPFVRVTRQGGAVLVISHEVAAGNQRDVIVIDETCQGFRDRGIIVRHVAERGENHGIILAELG